MVRGNRCSAPGRCGTARGPGALPRAAQGLPCARGWRSIAFGAVAAWRGVARDRSRGWGARREPMVARGRCERESDRSRGSGMLRGGGRRPGGQSVGPPGPCSNSPRAGVGRGILRGAGAVVFGERCSAPGRCGTARGPGALPRAAQGLPCARGQRPIASGAGAAWRGGARDRSRGWGARPGGQSVGPPGPCSNSPRADVGRGILRGAGAVVGGDRCSTPGRCGTARGPGALPRAAQGLPCARG